MLCTFAVMSLTQIVNHVYSETLSTHKIATNRKQVIQDYPKK